MGFRRGYLEDISKCLVTSIYKPFRPFGRRTTPVRRLTHYSCLLLTGMNLQVLGGYRSEAHGGNSISFGCSSWKGGSLNCDAALPEGTG